LTNEVNEGGKTAFHLLKEGEEERRRSPERRKKGNFLFKEECRSKEGKKVPKTSKKKSSLPHSKGSDHTIKRWTRKTLFRTYWMIRRNKTAIT